MVHGGGVFPIYYNITMGGGPNLYYVIYGRPLTLHFYPPLFSPHLLGVGDAQLFSVPRFCEVQRPSDRLSEVLLFWVIIISWGVMQTWNLSKILHRRIFRLKILHRQFHLILTVLVRKNTKNEWKWRNLHRWQKFYTAAGTDVMDKFHLCFRST